jgi:hypothetical protein
VRQFITWLFSLKFTLLFFFALLLTGDLFAEQSNYYKLGYDELKKLAATQVIKNKPKNNQDPPENILIAEEETNFQNQVGTVWSVPYRNYYPPLKQDVQFNIINKGLREIVGYTSNDTVKSRSEAREELLNSETAVKYLTMLDYVHDSHIRVDMIPGFEEKAASYMRRAEKSFKNGKYIEMQKNLFEALCQVHPFGSSCLNLTTMEVK